MKPSAQQVDASETRARRRLLRGHPSTSTRPSPADPLRWADLQKPNVGFLGPNAHNRTLSCGELAGPWKPTVFPH